LKQVQVQFSEKTSERERVRDCIAKRIGALDEHRLAEGSQYLSSLF